MMSKIEDSWKTLSAHAGILLGGFLALCFLNILNSAYSTVLVLIKEEFSLSYTLSGALMSSYFVGYTIGQIPWGYLADRFGSRLVMTLSVIGIALSTVLFGLSFDIWQAILSRFLAGLLGAGIFVPGVRLISSWFSPKGRGSALGILSVGGSIGLIAASWLTPLLAMRLGWRRSMAIFGILTILSSAVIWWTLRDRRGARSSTGIKMDIEEVIKTGSFWILALAQFIRLGSNYTFIAWLPLLLKEEYGLSLFSAGIAFSLFNFAGMLSNPVGGVTADLIGEKTVLLVSFFATALCILLFTVVKTSPIILCAAFILGWFINFVRSPSFSIIPNLYGVDVAGKISGIHNTFASMGALALPLLLGYIRDFSSSYHAGWMALSALLMFGTILNVFLRTPPGRTRHIKNVKL